MCRSGVTGTLTGPSGRIGLARMAQGFATSFYHSAAWRRNSKNYMTLPVDTSGHVVRYDGASYYFIDNDGEKTTVQDNAVVPPGMCERCFRMGQLRPAKLIHHIRHLTPENVGDPKVSLAYDNLMRVCQDCHAFYHSGRRESRVTFDADGRVVPTGNDTLAAQIMQLTETVDERRNVHSSGRRRW